MNIVILGGRLGAVPDVRYAPNGKAIATISIATTSRYKDGDEWKEKTQWHRAVEYRDAVAKFMKERLEKGSEVTIEGELTHRKYDDKGVTKYITEVIIKDLRAHGGRQHGASDDAPAPGPEDGHQYGDKAFGG